MSRSRRWRTAGISGVVLVLGLAGSAFGGTVAVTFVARDSGGGCAVDLPGPPVGDDGSVYGIGPYAAEGGDRTGPEDVRLPNLADFRGPAKRDNLVLVPLPSAAASGLLVLAVLGLLSLRRRRRM